MVCDLWVGMGFKPPRVGPFWTSSLMLVPTPAHRSWGEGARATMPGACGLGLLLALLLPPVVSASRPGTVFRLNKEVLSYGKRCAVRLSAMCVCERVSSGVHACRCVYNPKCTCVSMNSNPMGTWISLLPWCPWAPESAAQQMFIQWVHEWRHRPCPCARGCQAQAT